MRPTQSHPVRARVQSWAERWTLQLDHLEVLKLSFNSLEIQTSTYAEVTEWCLPCLKQVGILSRVSKEDNLTTHLLNLLVFFRRHGLKVKELTFGPSGFPASASVGLSMCLDAIVDLCPSLQYLACGAWYRSEGLFNKLLSRSPRSTTSSHLIMSSSCMFYVAVKVTSLDGRIRYIPRSYVG